MNATRLTKAQCALLATVLAFLTSPAAAIDILLRTTGEINLADSPIPADFFGPGSLPFDGIVQLVGVPSGPLGADTIVSRGPVLGGVETVPIELVELHLRSLAPIEVHFMSAPSSFFDIFIELSADTPATGAMQLQQESPFGGVITGSRFDNIDIVIGSSLPNFIVNEYDNVELLPPPVPFDFVGPPYYPALGFYPGSQTYQDETGRLTLTMVPAPEPSSFVLAGCGAALVFLLGRRARRHPD